MARRNNEGRTAAPHKAAGATPPPPVMQQREDDFLSFVTPTEFIELPSKGTFYPEGNPLYGIDTLEIRHMTAKEEDILTSEALLRKGLAVDRLLQSLLVDNTVKVDDLLIGDKNALVVGARISGFGPAYDTTVACPNCATSIQTEFDLESIVPKPPGEIPEGVALTPSNTFSFTLPTTGFTVEVRLLTSKDERAFTEQVEKKKKMKLPSSMTTDLLKTLIVSVEGRTDAATISMAVDRLPIKDSLYLKKVYEGIIPNVDLTHEFRCYVCSFEGRVNVPLTADFFWPNR
tara:strand:- start:200 stop:1063 length:864 start_codon:yes stop_codon:yes gene_type:complete